MRYVFSVLALLMLLAVAVQYNDPDGPLWMVYYGVPAVWCALAAFRPQLVAGTRRGFSSPRPSRPGRAHDPLLAAGFGLLARAGLADGQDRCAGRRDRRAVARGHGADDRHSGVDRGRAVESFAAGIDFHSSKLTA